MKKKLKNNGGLTLVEMLCAVAILVLLCLMMNTCLGMAVKTYRDITAESETELLVSTISDILSDKLRYCVVTEKTGTPTTYEYSFGKVIVDDDGKLIVEEKKVVETTGPDGTTSTTTVPVEKALLPVGAYGAYDKYDMAYIGKYKVEQVDDPAAAGSKKPLVQCNITDGTATFTVAFKITSAENGGITQTAEFTVRCLNPAKKEG